jgi:YfiH family protein
MRQPLEHPLLARSAGRHGFGVRDAAEPAGLLRPRQVHGADVTTADACASAGRSADAIVSRVPGVPVGVVTADCVPVLLAARGGRAVAAVHAGWRGLALGVIESAVAALRRAAGTDAALVAAIGPHIGPCCYEVDAPVIDALARRFPLSLDAALRPTRPGHALLDLGALARDALVRAGLPVACIGACGACTHCDPVRFHSYRRDGPSAGRLVHFISASAGEG